MHQCVKCIKSNILFSKQFSPLLVRLFPMATKIKLRSKLSDLLPSLATNNRSHPLKFICRWSMYAFKIRTSRSLDWPSMLLVPKSNIKKDNNKNNNKTIFAWICKNYIKELCDK